MESKTKKELIELVQELQEKCERLENDIDYWQEQYNDKDDECDELQDALDHAQYDYGIKNIDDFIFEMEKDGVYNNDVKEFIDHYLKYHNN